MSIDKFKLFIKDRIGIDLPVQSENSLKFFLTSRIGSLDKRLLDKYLTKINIDDIGQEEFQKLTEAITNGKTSFFRHPDQISAFCETVAPFGSEGAPPLNIWCAGCSTGEEVYSIAIALSERGVPARILGSDVDMTAINIAKRGVYDRWKTTRVDPSIIDKYFLGRSQGKFSIAPRISNSVYFEGHNLIDSRYPAPGDRAWDVIFCRNVLIYFTDEGRKRVILKMVDVLRPGGLIVLSPTESIHGICDHLQLVEHGGNYFYKYVKDPEELKHHKPYSKELRSAPSPPEDTRYTSWDTFKSKISFTPPYAGADDKRHGRDMREISALDERGSRDGGSPETETDIEAVNRKAKDAYHCGERRRAIGMLQVYLRTNPEDILTRVTLANALVGVKELSRAEEEYAKALDADPLLFETHFFLGMLHRKTGDLEHAIKSMKSALFLDRACWLASFYLAGLLSQTGENNRAMTQYRNTVHTIDESAEKTIAFKSLLHGMENVMQYRNDIRQLCMKKLDQMRVMID